MDNPPSYGDSNTAAAATISASPLALDVLPPTTLYVAGRFIHSSDPLAAPLYELSHSIGFLNDSNRSVRVERLDYAVKAPGGVAQLSTRKKHIYDLKHPTVITAPTFEYHAECTSRQSLCSFGLTSFRARKLSNAKGYRVYRAMQGTDNKLVCRDLLFSAVPARDRAVKYEWSNDKDQLVAREMDRDGLMSLLVSAEMAAPTRDALVSAWLSRVWWEQARESLRIF